MRLKRGFTLVEILAGLIMAPMVVLAAASLLIIEASGSQYNKDSIEIARDARVVVNHMVDVLRHAYPDTINATTDEVSATVAGGARLSFVATTGDEFITYTFDPAGHTLQYTQGLKIIVIAKNISGFDITKSGPYVLIVITASKGKASLTLRTQVRSIIE